MIAVNLFWDNQPLSKLEHACINSYLANNNKINVFSYKTNIFGFIKDKNFNCFNANEIIEEKNKFYYEGIGDCINKSVVGFSDIFRYELLKKMGGWYSDFDVINLKPLYDIDNNKILFRPHINFKYICNIAKFPKDFHLLDILIKDTTKTLNSKNNQWVLPLKIFRDFIEKHKLEKFCVDEQLFGNDNPDFLSKIIFQNFYESLPLVEKMYSIHLCSSAFKTGNWSSRSIYDFNKPKKLSLLEFLYSKYL